MSPESPNPSPPLLEVRGLEKTFAGRGFPARRPPVVAARDVSFRLDRGEAVALVGESGSGKSTVARLLLRLESADGGEIRLDGRDVREGGRRPASLAYRRRVQMVFQDPFGSLNPVHDVGYHLMRPLLRHGRADRTTARSAALELLSTVGLEPAAEFIDRHPYELSGGQRQRVAIARALAVQPDLLVADEPTSMLDVSIRMGILNLLAGLKQERGVSILLITHDLASARYLCDRVLVLFRGRVVEEGTSHDVVEAPAHPYTRALLASIADTARPAAAAAPPAGATPLRQPTRPGAAGPGCPFLSRCPDAREICARIDPAPRAVRGQSVRCHLYPEAGVAAAGN